MMRITVNAWDGKAQDGILLVWRPLEMRVAILGAEDAMELQFRGGQWLTETNEPVTVEFHPAIVVDEDPCDSGDEAINAASSMVWAATTPAWLN